MNNELEAQHNLIEDLTHKNCKELIGILGLLGTLETLREITRLKRIKELNKPKQERNKMEQATDKKAILDACVKTINAGNECFNGLGDAILASLSKEAPELKTIYEIDGVQYSQSDMKDFDKYEWIDVTTVYEFRRGIKRFIRGLKL